MVVLQNEQPMSYDAQLVGTQSGREKYFGENVHIASLCVNSVMICATLVNKRTDTHTDITGCAISSTILAS